MSGESLQNDDAVILRGLREEEYSLLCEFAKFSPASQRIISALENAVVSDMEDGEMGSIKFHYADSPEREFAFELAKGEYRDSDNVLVSIAFDLDQYGDPFELDFWKVNFAPLQRYPRAGDVKMIPKASA